MRFICWSSVSSKGILVGNGLSGNPCEALKPTIHAGMGMWVVPGIRTRIQIARSLVTIHAEIRTRVAPGQGESPKFPRPCHQSSRGRGIA
ncbi:hypothetical protein ElyMa_000432500 [Elysia marginata]|uniref:Uncharacterized protein n=1 Tax=Elysia marginata TaxID=1093978 RepID=A0AAV4FQM0_9GAST|nr:hypothetical protein ElyMa_000432500 [Elysia marginata]